MKKLSISIIILLISGGVFLIFRRPVENITTSSRSEKYVEAAFQAVDCPIQPRTFPDGAYTGPMIDAHVHIAPLPDGPVPETPSPNESPQLGVSTFIDNYICAMDAEGTRAALAFFPVWDPIRRQMLDVVKQTMDKYPNRFIPFIMPPNQDDRPTGFPTVDADTLSDMLGVYPHLFKGYGEIGLYAREGGSPELKPDANRLSNIYPVVRQNKLLVYFHLGQGHQDEFEKVLEQNRDITFIFHGDQLIEDAGGGDNLDLIDEILTKHPNVRYGVDELYGDVFLMKPGTKKEDFIAHFNDPEPLLKKDLQSWRSFIEKHPDQVMWDTDRGWSAPWSLDPDVAIVLNNYSRMFIGRLDRSVQEKYAYKNAEALTPKF